MCSQCTQVRETPKRILNAAIKLIMISTVVANDKTISNREKLVQGVKNKPGASNSDDLVNLSTAVHRSGNKKTISEHCRHDFFLVVTEGREDLTSLSFPHLSE